MERKISVVLERKDYVKLFTMLMNKKLLLLAAIPLIIAIPVGAALLAYFASGSNLSLGLLLVPYVGLIVVLLLIFVLALISPALKQFKQASRQFGNRFTFVLSSEGFICTGGENEAQYNYAKLSKAIETKNYIFFFVNAGQACIFPKREMSETDLEFLKSILPKCAILPAEELADELNALVEGDAAKRHENDIPLDGSNDPLA